MENNISPEANKGKAKKIVWFSLGTLALGAATFFGIKIYKKHKNNTDDTDTQTTNDVDDQKTVPPASYSKPRASLPAANAGNAFPLRIGAKGDKVVQLQQSLIRTYGAGILARYGADGQFGSELAAALRAKGYGVPLQETDFQKITQEKASQPAPTPKPLVAFDSAAIAKALYTTITNKDFDSSITLLKGIRDTSNYALVSEKLKEYYINGVRQTLVNAMLSTFSNSVQKTKVQDTLKSIGLKYNGNKWSLSGWK